MKLTIPNGDIFFSLDKDLCEECGRYKYGIVGERFWSRAQRGLAQAIEHIEN